MDENYLVKKKNEEEEKRKKKGFLFFRNRKLFLLALALLFTIVILSTSTYAWFTSNSTVSVQPIDVQVSSGSGIQISTDAEHWKSMITTTDISTGYSGGLNKMPDNEMSPVSTVKTVFPAATTKSAGLHMYRGNITNDVDDGTMYLESTEELDNDDTYSNYIAFDLFLKLDYKATEDAPTQMIYFTSGTGITATGSAHTNIEYAGRMGFVVNGNLASSYSPTDFRNIKDSDSYVVKIYEPNYDVHTPNGIANGRDNYNITGYSVGPDEDAVPYYGVKAAFTYDENAAVDQETGRNSSAVLLSSTASDKFDSVTPDYYSKAANEEAFQFLALKPGVTKIRVYMWIEGQDIDCENTASGGQVQFSLGFTVTPPASAQNNNSGGGEQNP